LQNTSASVHRGATSAYRQVATLSQNTAVTVNDQFINKAGETWYNIKLHNGTLGWIKSTFLSTEPVNNRLIVGTLSAEIRRGADYGYRVTEKLVPFSTVTAVGEFINNKGQKWINIELSNGKRGWVPSGEVFTSLTERIIYYTNKNNVLRRGASPSYKVNTTINVGEHLTFIQRHNNWINVEAQNGIRGWIPENDLVKMNTNKLTNLVVTSLSKNETLLTWKKSKSFPVSYSIQSDKSLKINASDILVDLPQYSINGLASIKNEKGHFIVSPTNGYSFTLRNYEDKFTIKISKASIVGKRILIDPGHGDTDPGAIGPTKLEEKTVNLAVAKLLQEELTKEGAIVTLTRTTDEYLELSERTDISNGANYDAFISIHANSFDKSSANGTETFYNLNTNFNGPKSVVLAETVQKSLVSHLKTNDRRHKAADFYVLKNNEVPSILVELAFISNPTEEKLLRSKAFQQSAARGITQGLINYFNGGY